MRNIPPACLLALLAVTCAVQPTLGQNFVINGSFEAPAMGYNAYQYGPVAGSSWTFSPPGTGGSGITSLPSLWSGAPGRPPYSAVDGTQVAFIQAAGNAMSQSITLPEDGTYRLSYYHAGRSFFPGQGGNLTYSIFLGGSNLGTFSTTTDMPFTPVSFTFDALSGSHLLEFVAISGGSETIDQTAFFDSLQLTTVPEPGGICLLTALGLGAFALRRRHSLS